MTVLIKSNQKVPKTLQGFFNRAWQWAARPEFKPCVDEYGECKYRSNDGNNACFIGACIPDKLYTENMEEMEAPASLWSLTKRLGITVSTALLGELQRCHDETATLTQPAKAARARLRAFARYHDLKIPINKKTYEL